MPLSRQAIEELKSIHLKEFGTSLTDDEAWEIGHRLIRLFDVITLPEAERKDILRGSTRVRFDPTARTR